MSKNRGLSLWILLYAPPLYLPLIIDASCDCSTSSAYVIQLLLRILFRVLTNPFPKILLHLQYTAILLQFFYTFNTERSLCNLAFCIYLSNDDNKLIFESTNYCTVHWDTVVSSALYFINDCLLSMRPMIPISFF